jgi:ribonuclease R
MVHRLLHEILESNVLPDKKMDEKCKHCSERERAAMEAERAGNKYKQVEYMMDKLGEDMDGVISGVSSFGFWVETVNEKCEGLVNVKDLSDYDDFRHDDADYALVGMRTGKKFRMGDKVRIKLVAANLEKRQLDFDWIPGVESLREKAIKGKKKVIKN